MDLNLKEKVFIITGGAMGIGAAITRLIATEGGIPVMVGRSKAEGEQLVAEIEQAGGQALSIHKELGSSESCKEAIEITLKKYQRIDGLINNAGGNDGISLEGGSPEAWLASLQRNLHHYFYLAHYALPTLKQSKGAIVNISSKTAITGQGSTSPYAAAKGAQLALTREWAVELLPYGIRVNAIVPAEVYTPMYEKWINTFDNPQQKLNDISTKIPLEGRMTKASEIANMAVFLLSERASHITGQHLFVDGGYVHLDRALAVLNTDIDKNKIKDNQHGT